MTSNPDRFVLLDRGYQYSVTITLRQVVTLSLPTVYGSFLAAAYGTPSGNQPKGFANQLVVLPGGPAVSADATPVGLAPADPNGGAIVYPSSGKFTADPCVCGYAVGPAATSNGKSRYPNIAATAYLPQGANTAQAAIQTSAPLLDIVNVQTAFVIWKYALPAGMNPQQNGAWIGLWFGACVPYGIAPAFSSPIVESDSAGMAAMAQVTMSGKSDYTGALFTSGYSPSPDKLQLTAIAAMLQFTTGPPQGG